MRSKPLFLSIDQRELGHGMFSYFGIKRRKPRNSLKKFKNSNLLENIKKW